MLAYALSVLHGQNNNPTPFERLLRRDRTIVSIALLILILLTCEKKYIDVGKSQPDMACGTHVITGGTARALPAKSHLPATHCPRW